MHHRLPGGTRATKRAFCPGPRRGTFLNAGAANRAIRAGRSRSEGCAPSSGYDDSFVTMTQFAREARSGRGSSRAAPPEKEVPVAQRYVKPGWFTKHIFNRLVAVLTRLGLSVWGSRVLEVDGRTDRRAATNSGQPANARPDALSRRTARPDAVGADLRAAGKGHPARQAREPFSATGCLTPGRRRSSAHI